MITRTKEFNCQASYPFQNLADPEEILFFDIETTGLSARKNHIYLIGCVYQRDGQYMLKQWFADKKEDEPELILHFLLFASRFRLLIHFNGSTFDVPFLKTRAEILDIPGIQRIPKELDLYKQISPLRKVLPLPDLKQKTLEAFLGNGREDLYNGGELIRIYQEYLKKRPDELYDLLILHNEEDIKGLPVLASMLHYPDFFAGPFQFESAECCTLSESDREDTLILTAVSSAAIPQPLHIHAGDYYLICCGSTLKVRIPLIYGTFLYYFPDYQNYYYLPDEDMAIHKSVAEFVDRSHRKKATARNCYQKKNDLFLPFCAQDTDLPVFYSDLTKKHAFLSSGAPDWQDPVFLNKYLSGVFTQL